jgi:D-aminopeptidase
VIRAAAARAAANVAAGAVAPPPYEAPFEFEIELRSAMSAEARANAEGRGIDVVDERTAAFRHDDMAMAYRMAIFCTSLASGAGNRGW